MDFHQRGDLEMLKELSTEVLDRLRKHPQSARQLATAMHRDPSAIRKACRRLHKLGFIRRDRQKWIFVTSEAVLEAYKTDWSIDSAREFYLNGLLSKTSLASPKDLTVVGSIRRMWDEAARYLEHHHPETIEYGERARASRASLFNVFRQAHAHDRHTFDDIVTVFVEEQFDVVADCIRAYRCTSQARIEADRLFFVWLLMGSPDPMPDTFRFPNPPAPTHDEASLAHAWRLAYDDECTFTEDVAYQVFDMLVVLDEAAVMREFADRQPLTQETFTTDATTEPLGERS
jgi:hypothetical protein